jgi:hypothetical protein
MNVKLIFEILTAAVLVAVAVWQWRQLVRNPKDLPLQVLVTGVSSIAFVLTLGLPFDFFEPLHEALDPIYFSNIAFSLMICSYAVFFFLVGPTQKTLGEQRRRMVYEFAGLAAAMAVMLVVAMTAPPGTWHSPRLPEDYRTWQNIVFYLSSSGYTFAIWILGTIRALRYLRRLVHPWARTAVTLVVLGTAAMEVGVDAISLLRQLLYIVYPGSKWPLLKDLYNIGRLGGQIILAAGLAAAPLAALVPRARDSLDGVRKRRYTRRLQPLWQRLTDEFPYIVLPHPHDALQRRQTSVHARFELLISEITDGLAHLAPYYPPDHADPAGVSDPHQAAVTIDHALRARAEARRVRWAGGERETALPPYPKIEPDFAGWRDRARWMAEVGHELDRTRSADRRVGCDGVAATN